MHKPFRHGRHTKAKASTGNTLFGVGDGVRHIDTRDVGHVEAVRDEGMINVRWASGRTEWLPASDLCWAPDVATRRR